MSNPKEQEERRKAAQENAPPPPLVSAKKVSKPADPIAATGVKAGFDPMRPFRYVWGFVTGTVSYGLNGISGGARKGMMWGAIALVGYAFAVGAGILAAPVAGSVLASIAGNVLTAAAVGVAVGGVVGGVLGGAIGTATGGAKGVGRLRRAEKYADDLLEKQKAKKTHAGVGGPDYRDYYRAHQERRDYLYDRIHQIQVENNRDTRTYWQDHVRDSRGGGQGYGQGF